MPRRQRRPPPPPPASLRIAVCLSGLPKAIVTPRMQQHLASVLQPLADDPDTDLDVFMHMDGQTMDEWAVRHAARRLRALNVLFYGNSSMGEEPPNLGDCPTRNRAPCCRHGYAASVKLRGCLRDIEANERPPQRPYDFVLRLRPDIEHLFRLPPSRQWRCLRRDIAWAMIVLPNTTTHCFPGHAYPRARLADGLVPVTKPGLFLDDNLALLPRRAAQAYLSVADQIEKCVPTRPLNRLCQRRWEWPECRVHQALATVPGLLIGELPSTTPAFAFVDCEGPDKNGPPCVQPYRRWKYRHFSERTGLARSSADGFLGGKGLNASRFPTVALRQGCSPDV